MLYRNALMAVAIATGVSTASADDVLKIGITPSMSTGLMYVAKEEGIFARHGIDAEMTNGNGSVLIAGVVSRSMDLSMPTVTNFLQAVDSGLPLSIVAGGNVVSHSRAEYGLVYKNDSGIGKPADLVGKTVGVTSIGAFLHVLFQQWLVDAGVDPATVNYVETPFPQMADVLKQGTVDAVVAVEPFVSRIISSQSGVAGPDFTESAPEGLPVLVFVASNDWIAENSDVLERFRASLDEAAAFIQANPDKSKADSNVYLKMPDNVLSAIQMPEYRLKVDPQKIELWIGMMKSMGFLNNALVANDLVK